MRNNHSSGISKTVGASNGNVPQGEKDTFQSAISAATQRDMCNLS
ncbi:MAG TPA: hypothetical protein VFD03_09945 [Clostridia bacterium]|nr:hypothetical protein [Clostridia bacterium]